MTWYFVLNEYDEAFSNMRDPKPLQDLRLEDVRDYGFREKKRAEETLEYIQAFETEPENGSVSESVKETMTRVARDNWTIQPYELEFNISRA